MEWEKNVFIRNIKSFNKAIGLNYHTDLINGMTYNEDLIANLTAVINKYK